MVDRNIVNKLGMTNEELEQEINGLFTEECSSLLEKELDQKVEDLIPGTILTGKIVSQIGSDVIVELGLKSEGLVEASEFDDPEDIVEGKEIEVLLEEMDADGSMLLSKRKADRIRGWEHIINTKEEGDVVTGRVTRRIKGGLLVDIGVPVFLPASQVDIRKPGDISRFIGEDIECKILKIDTDNRNIVVSRRRLIEEEREVRKQKILEEIEEGQVRKGIVKNIADFGVFVDLGGVDGLLHISDLSWGRVSHPSEVVEFDQEIEVMVIGVDKENEKISLGLKQKQESPWKTVEDRYPVGARVKGTVVNIMNYGAFVRLEEGIEGLVHISEMSWTKRISHPGDVVTLGEEIEVVVLDVNKDKQEISLGIKQLEANPWTVAAQKYPAGTIVDAKVTGLTNYGAFVEIEPGIDGLIHISDLSWTKKYNHPNEALDKGQDIKCVVLDVDEEKHRVSLGIKQLTEDPWKHAIPSNYMPGQIVKGHVTKLTNFGVFVELEEDLEGLLHISELADEKIDKPQDVVNVGDELEVKILRVDTDSRKIGLSLRRVQWSAEEAEQAGAGQAPQEGEGGGEEEARRGGLDGSLMPDTLQIPKREEGSEEEKSE
ncbi:30S ribosomal protein S1 [Anaerohalosphaera lusitana]|uniref:30S ribosomal protein S1 n=1 Tax=Anaerohalosphaera lusitana TaxID=1936003 RepID=A0A1U9NIR4_9BACT|nr:30S ribosomal protein S1 [Anaerohalosphaera lusitana]AQT67677.1 30S ribosomal protein S1 [Anaerohalosphaera lusitana]